MRGIGFALVLAGAFFAYLGWSGKLGRAWIALRTGSDPGASDTGYNGLAPGNTQGKTPANPSGNPGKWIHGGIWGN